MKSKDELLAVVGPTASGKTKLGLQLAQEQKGEIISVDSRQVYRYLSIGTAKPRGQWAVNRAPCTETSDHGSRSTVHESLYLFEGVPYHLVDFLDPDQRFSAADFVKLATEKVHDIQQRGKTPILVGGTGLYFKALTEGLASLPQASPELRARLKKEAQEKGREFLHQKLQAIDPEAAKKIPAHNIQRLIRALEVYELTGKPISHWHQGHEQKGLPLKFIGIDPPREALYRRIEQRGRSMMENGIIEETKDVLNHGYSEGCPALSGLGYPRVIAYLKGKLSKEECLRLLIQDTRQYAKRQMTWFRHQLPVQWSAFAKSPTRQSRRYGDGAASADHPPKQRGTA